MTIIIITVKGMFVVTTNFFYPHDFLSSVSISVSPQIKL
jgi:hypothetical protein